MQVNRFILISSSYSETNQFFIDVIDALAFTQEIPSESVAKTIAGLSELQTEDLGEDSMIFVSPEYTNVQEFIRTLVELGFNGTLIGLGYIQQLPEVEEFRVINAGWETIYQPESIKRLAHLSMNEEYLPQLR